MKEGLYRSEYIPPEDRNLHRFRGATLLEVIEYLEGKEAEKIEQPGESGQESSIFDGFLDLLRSKGVRVSTPEWLQFLRVVDKRVDAKQLQELVGTSQLLNRLRLFAQTTLVKNKADEAAFHEAFDEYFELAAKIFNRELPSEEKKKKDEQGIEVQENSPFDSGIAPEIKEQLGIKEVAENLNLPENREHNDDEAVHGGQQDQHNDILQKADLAKQGGGDKKEGTEGAGATGSASEGQGDKGDSGAGKGDKGDEGTGQGDKGGPGSGKGDKGDPGAGQGDKGSFSGLGKRGAGVEINSQEEQSQIIPESPQNIQTELSEQGYLVGGGKGKSVEAARVERSQIVNKGERASKENLQEREKKVAQIDRRKRYEVRPDRASINEVIRNIRRVILDVSDVKTKSLNLQGTVKNFARRDFRFDYQRERDKQPEIVLLIDVGGPVDEWSPLVKELAEAMSEGLTKLEIYLFHNNLYGYVWQPDAKNLLASSYARDNSLIDLKSIIKKRKKVIIYGDAEMSYSEFEDDGWPPRGNEERVRRFGMGGEECLRFIKRQADSVVWINPVFQKEWEERDGSGTIEAISRIINMHDLTVGGVEDAIKDLMNK